MYKISKFTFYCTNSKDEILLFNTFKGLDSVCKLQNIKHLKYFKEQNTDDFTQNVIEQLLNKGIIVESNVNENQKLFCKTIDTIKSNKLVLFINPTEKCNFRCKYCYESFNNDKMSIDTQNQIINYVKGNIHKYSGLHVAWFGGEPLLALNCVRYLSNNFINICKLNKRRYESSMTTNGYLLNVENFKSLLDLKVKKYQITIDGTEAIHNKYRVTTSGKGTFNKIINNLCEIKKLKRKDFLITLRSNITKEVFDNIDKYLEIIESLVINDYRFSTAIFKAGNWLNKADESIRADLIEDNMELKKIYQAILNSNRKINLSTIFLNPGTGTCYAGKLNNFLICADGSVHKCTVTFEDPKTSVGKLKNGNIEVNDFYYTMISNFNNCEEFYSCFNAPICMGNPCPIRKEKNHKCSYLKQSIELILQILDKEHEFPIILEG